MQIFYTNRAREDKQKKQPKLLQNTDDLVPVVITIGKSAAFAGHKKQSKTN
jgi:hypothetical protein